MFSNYVETLQRLAFGHVSRNPRSEDADVIDNALDGGPSFELAKSESLHDRRLMGAFFTGSAVADRMATHWCEHVEKFTYVDPACGAGDLLLAVAQRLPALDSLKATLRSWGECLVGFDLDTRFISATKARLTLLARQRSPDGWRTSVPRDSIAFPNIVVADGLSRPHIDYSDNVRLLMNPPYSAVQAPEDCSWATGGVCAAAVFLDHLDRPLASRCGNCRAVTGRVALRYALSALA